MQIRGLKTALHMVVAATVAFTSLTLTPMVAEAVTATVVAPTPAMVCSGATCSVTFPYVSGKYYEYTPIVGSEITLQVNGGAGGKGGDDSHAGGAGATGSRVQMTLTPSAGSVLKIYPGSAGTNGASYVAGTGGGAGGLSTYGDYNGGTGAPACNTNSSGAGAGGGAASVVQIGNTTPLIIAGGGGGGGGGGNYGNGTAGVGPSSNGLTYGSNGGGGGGCDGGSGAGGGGGLNGGVGGSVGWASYGSYGEFFGYGGASGSSGGPTGSTLTNNASGVTGNGYVVVTFLNLFANITASDFINSSEVAFNVAFPRDVTGLTSSDFSIDTAATTATGCGAPSVLTGSGSSYTIKVTGCSEGFLGIKLADAAAVDTNSLSTWLSYSNKVTIDRTAAGLTITPPASPSNAATLNFSVATNEALTAGSLTTADFSVTGAGCSVTGVTAPTAPAVSPYTVAVTGCSTAQNVALTAKAASTTDLAGNSSPVAAVTSSAVVTDYLAPSGAWVTPTLATTNAPTVYFTMLTAEPIAASSLAASDFTNAGTATGCVFAPTTAGQTITLAVTGCSAGTVIPRLALGSITDLSGNSGPAAAITGPTITRDLTLPTATIVASPTTTPSMATVLNYNVTFTEAVSGLTASDFTNSGTATGCIFVPTLAANGLTATLAVNFCADGTVIPTLAASSVIDAAGNAAPATATNGTTITLDRTPLAFTSGTTTANAIANNTSIVYTLTATELWANMEAADFVNTGTATGCTFALAWVSGNTFTATVTGCSTAGTLKPVVTARSMTDVVGNLSPVAAYALPELTLDRVAPVVVAGDFPDENVATFIPLTYTYTFSEPIVDSTLTAADFSNVGAATTATGCVYSPVVSADHLSATVTVTGCSEGNVKLRLAANSLTDIAGNTGPAAVIDSPVTALINTAPRVTFTANPPALTNSLTLSYTASFSENVTGVSASAFVLSGTAPGCALTSSVINPASAVNATNLTVTCTGEGTVIVSTKANYLTDTSTSLRPGPESRVDAATVTIDRTAPTVTFTPIGAVTSPTGVPSQTFRLNFNEPINPATLVAGDFTNAGAATAAIGCVFTPTVAADGRSADVVVTGCGSGNLLPQLVGSGVQDVAGNSSTSAVTKLADAAAPGTPITIVMDRTAPTATLVGNPATTPTAGPSLSYNLTFNEAVSGLTASDFTNTGTATGCVFAPASATGAAATPVAVAVTGCASGTVVLTLAAGSVLDSVGMPGPLSNLVATAITLDVNGPVVTDMATTFSGALASATNVAFTTKFDQATSNIVASDFENAGTATGCVFAPAAATVLANTNLSIAVTGCSEGTLIPRLKAASVTDAVGNTGPATAWTMASTIVLDNTAPTATIATTLPANTNATSLTYTVTFSDSVTGIAAADFSNSAATGAATGCVFLPSAASGTVITVNVNSCSAGNVVLKLAASSVANLSAQAGPTAFVEASPIVIERTAPTAMVIAPVSPNNSLTQNFQLTFGENVTGLTLDDLDITGVSGCTSALSAVTATSAVLTVSRCGTGTLRVALKPGSVTDVFGNTGPTSEVVTEVGIDRTAPVFSITAPATPTNAATLTYSVVVSEAIPAGSLTASDFVVTGSGCQVGTLTAPVSGVSPYTLTVTGCADTSTAVVSLPARAASDLAANLGPVTTVTAASVSVDRVKPDSTITTSFPAVTNASIISYTIVTSESIDPATVVAADFANAASAPVATGCVFSPYVVGKTITVTITGCSEGNLVLKQLADSMTDTGANTGPALIETGPVIRIDRTTPTETLVAAVTTTPSSAATFTYNATFPEAVTGLTGSDFTNTGTATGCVFTPATSTPAAATAVAVVVSGCSEGTLIVNQVAGAVTDLGGNTGPETAFVMAPITIDRTAATATITTAATSPSNATSIAYTVTFSEAITGLAASDFTNDGTATGCAFTVSAASGTTITLTVTSCAANGTLKPKLALGAVNDGALTASPIAAVVGPELTLDRTAPAVTAGTVPAATLTAEPVSLVYTYTFSEAIQDSSLTAADFSNVGAATTATNCVITPVVAVDHLSATVTVTKCSDGNVKLRLAANAVTDLAGNTGPSVLIDSSVTTAINTAPRVSFTTAPGANSNAATLNYVATFSESVKDVTAGDFSLTGSTATDCVLTLTSPANATTATTTATFSIAGCSPGTVVVTMPVGAVTEAATSVTGPLTALVSTTTIDRSVATATIAGVGVITSPTAAASMTFRLTFNEPIQASSLTASDITNGAAAYVDPLTSVVTPAAVCTFGAPVLAGDGLSATVEVTNCTSGLLNPKLGSGQVLDLAGTPSPATTVKLANPILLDRTVPTGTLVPVVSTSPTAAATSVYTLSFSEPVTGVAASDFTNSGTASGCTFSVAGSGATYTVTASNCGSGTLIPNFVAGAAADLLGNAGPASNVVASSITLDKSGPTATIANNRGSQTARVWNNSITVTLNEAIQASSLTLSDFELVGTATDCTLTSLAYTANSTSITLTVPANTCSEGSLVVRLKANSVIDILGNAGPAENVDTVPTYVSDGGVPAATWTSTPTSPNNGSSLNFTLTLSDWVTGFTAGNFSNAITSANGGATGCVFTPSASAGITITVAVTGCSTGQLALKLAASQVYEVYGTYGPAAAVTASTVVVDRALATATITSVYGSEASNPKFVVDFSEPISGLTIADFAVQGDSACVPTITSQTATRAEVSVANCAAGSTIRLTLANGSVSDGVANASPLTVVSSEPVLVLLAEQAPLTVSTNLSTIVYGSTTQVKATVPASGTPGGGSGTGAVSFATSTPSVCSINASSGVITQLAVGDCMLSATRAGSATFLPTTSPEVKVRLARQSQLPLVAVASPSTLVYNPAAQPQTVTISTTGGSGSGEVTAVIDELSADVCSIEGLVVTIHLPGACVVDVTKAGGNVYEDAAASVSVNMAKADQAAITPVASVASATWDAVTPIMISVPNSGPGSGSGSGEIVFTTTTSDVCGVDGQTGQIIPVDPVVVGTCTVVATRSGDAYFNNKSSESISVTLTKGSQESLVIVADDSEGSISDTIAITVSDQDGEAGSGAGVVTFAITSPSQQFCSINANTGVITGKKPGDCVVIATKAADEIYLEQVSAPLTVQIVKAPQEILFAPIAQLFNGGKPVLTGTGKPFAVPAVSTAVGITPTFVSLTPAVCTVTGAMATPKALGLCRITASAASNESYLAATDVTKEILILEKPIPQVIAHTPPVRISLAAPDTSLEATLKSVFTVGAASVNNFVTPVLAIDKTSVKNCSVVGGKLHGLVTGPCTYTLSSPAIGAFLAAAPVKFTTTFFAADNVTTQVYPAAVADEPHSIVMSGDLLELRGASSANQVVSYSTTNPDICWADSLGSLHLAGAGVCTFSAISGGGSYTVSTSAPLSFTITKSDQVGTYVAPGEIIPGTSPVRRAPAATDNANGFVLEYKLNSGQPPVFVSLDPTVCSVEDDGTVTWENDIPAAPATRDCRISVSAPATAAYNALAPQTITVSASHSTVPAWVPGAAPMPEKPVFTSVPRTGGTVTSGANTFAVTVKSDKIEVKPMSRGQYIGKIIANVSIPYKVMVGGVLVSKTQTCTTTFGTLKKIAANKSPMAQKKFTNSVTCAMNKDAFAWFKTGASIDITATVTRLRVYPTTMKPVTPSGKPIPSKTVVWHLMVG